MKILLTLFGNIVNSSGGVEKVLCNMANAMSERGHEVTILGFENKKGEPFFHLEKSVKYYNFGYGFKYNHLKFNLTNIFTNKRNKELKRLLYDGEKISTRIHDRVLDLEPDIIITFEKRSDVVFKEFIDLDAPIVSMFHFDYKTVLSNEFLFDLYRKSDCIQVLTDDDLQNTKRLLDFDKVVLIPNVVPQFKEKAVLENPAIINVGRIESKQKRQALLIEAFAKISKKYPEWSIHIYGSKEFDKKYYNKCCDLVSKYGLKDRVLFHGLTVNVNEKLLEGSIFAFPSAYEGFALAMTEAMSVGLPVIGFASCKSVSELVIDNVSGILVDDGVDSFADGIERLIKDKELRLKCGSKAKIQMKQYSPDIIWGKWEELLNSLVNQKKAVE